MKTVAFRVDASKKIGSGHVMRCLALARALRKQHHHCVFICRELEGHLIESLKTGFEVQVLPAPAQAASTWLEVSLEQDLQDTQQALSQISKLDYLVVDHYELNKKWETAIRRQAPVLVIDDLANRKHDCDVLLDQTASDGFEKRYQNLVPSDAIKLLGPRFALMSSEFQASREQAFEQRQLKRNNLDRIVVYFGASDQGGTTLRVLNFLKNLKSCRVDIVLGANSPDKLEIMETASRHDHFIVHEQVSNMAQFLINCDLFIGAGGVSMWERACLGVPSLVISMADNQKLNCETLAQKGAIIYLGDHQRLTSLALQSGIEFLLHNHEQRFRLSQAGMKVVDAKGVDRVVQKVFSDTVELRAAHKEDMQKIFEWRNHPGTRKFIFDSRELSFEEHKKWYEKVLQSQTSFLLIGHRGSQELGVLRFDVDLETQEALVSVYLVPGIKGEGLGLLKAGTRWLKKNVSSVKKIKAEIMPGNRASEWAFTEAGYTLHHSGFELEILNG